MEIRQLRYLVHVAEAGSFSRAASVLGIAQPALSRQVHALEQELKQRLLIRDGRGVRPTEAGTRLLAHARSILGQVQEAANEVLALRGSPVGSVSIGMPATLAKLLIVPVVTEFRRRFPHATIRITEGLSTYLREFLGAGRIDAALLYDVKPSAALEIMPVLTEQLLLISAKPLAGAPREISASALARLPLILAARPNAIRARVERHLAALGRQPSILLEIDAIAPALELVAAGHGHTILSRNALSAWGGPTARLIATPLRPRLKAELSMVVSRRGPLTPLQAATLDMVRGIGRRILV
jgi:LysR family nitrogen assimilation transcriptional regulator